MRKDVLVKKYPWTNHPHIIDFSEKFTDTEWEVMNSAGVPQFLKSGIVDPHFNIALFDSILKIARDGNVIVNMRRNQITFRQIVQNQINILTQTAKQQGFIRISEVEAWLGPELMLRLKQDVTNYNSFDNFMQTLSSASIREKLLGKGVTAEDVYLMPSHIAQFSGKDIRKMYLTHQMSFQQFFEYALHISKPIQRIFPSWVPDSIELKNLLNTFTDNQLLQLGSLLDASILKDSALLISFIRVILNLTTVKGKQTIQLCNDAYSFKNLILTMQKQFLHILLKESRLVNAVQSSNRNEAGGNENLIRKYINDYKSVHIPIPTDSKRKQELYQLAFRAAANIGNFWDVIVLLHYVGDINSQGAISGKTALHFAAAHAANTGQRLCYDLLLSRTGINPSIRDNNNRTAAELLIPTLQSHNSISVHSI